MRRLLLVSQAGEAASLRRVKALAEALVAEGCQPIQIQAREGEGLELLRDEARSGSLLGLVLLGPGAAELGPWLSKNEPGSSLERLPRVLVLFPPFKAKIAAGLEGLAPYYPALLALGADKKTAGKGVLPSRPWTLRKSADPTPDKGLLPRLAQAARGKAARALIRVLSLARKSGWKAPPPKASAGPAPGEPILDLVAAGPQRLVALFPRDQFPRESVFILHGSGGLEQRRVLASGSSLWFELPPGTEAEAEIRGPDGRVLARSGPLKLPGLRSQDQAGTRMSESPIRPPRPGPSSW